MKQLITKVSVDGETVLIYPAGFIDGVKAAVAYFAGPEGWGITMNIALSEVEDFVNDHSRVRGFIYVAKDKLGLEKC